MIRVLNKNHVKRITVTGGEPLLLGEELLDFLSLLHDQKIHTCLSTTGIFLSEKDVLRLDGCKPNIT